ncbi:MAG: hypothetical protein A4E48_00119 [Methanosaeta sp. PtaU1.Bin060]|nr:MAG: hypothetical protein A4E48_00119 [Methanosaeta sp. PtaU1.Bin060]
MTSHFRQCSAFRPDGERCGRKARKGSEFCYSHRNCQNVPPERPDPIPSGVLTRIDANAWGFCDFCGDAYPQSELWPDGNNRPACRYCWFRSDVAQFSQLADYEVSQAAWRRGLPMEAATAVLLAAGYRMQESPGCTYFVRKGEAH